MMASQSQQGMDRSSAEDRGRAPGATRVARLVALAGMLGALGAASCCIAPLALFSLGITGAWIGNLASLAPYQAYFIVPTLALLTLGFVMVYAKPKAVDGAVCAHPALGRVTKPALWTATALILAALAFPYVAPVLLGV